MYPLTHNEMIRAAATASALALALAPFGPTHGGLAAQEHIELTQVTTFPESFGLIQTVRALPDGGVVVADPLGRVLALVDMDAGSMEPLGREGGGPGEWRQPDAVYPLPGDSTLLVDLGNTRLAVLDPEGRIVESYPMVMEGSAGPMGLEIIQPGGTDAMGRVYFQARGGMRPGAGPDSSWVKRWVPGDEATTSIAALRPPAVAMATSGGRGNQEVRIRPIPLAPQDDWAVAPDGSVAIVRAEPYHVEWVGPDGRLVRGPAVDYRPVDVGRAEQERYLDDMETGGMSMSMTMENGVRSMQMQRGGMGGQGPSRAAQIRDLEWPETAPAIREGSALVAPDGRLWVQRYAPAGDPARYDLFDRDGARVATAELPAGRRIVGFDGDRVFAVNTDDLGLNWLEVYR